MRCTPDGLPLGRRCRIGRVGPGPVIALPRNNSGLSRMIEFIKYALEFRRARRDLTAKGATSTSRLLFARCRQKRVDDSRWRAISAPHASASLATARAGFAYRAMVAPVSAFAEKIPQLRKGLNPARARFGLNASCDVSTDTITHGREPVRVQRPVDGGWLRRRRKRRRNAV